MAEQRTLDAERADFEAWALKCGFKPTTFSHRVGASYLNQYLEDYWTCWQAARRAPPALDTEGLPALGDPAARMYVQNGYRRASVLPGAGEPLYTAEQVRQAMRDAAAADRRAREQAHLVDMAQWARENGLNVPVQWQGARQSAPEGAPVGGCAECDARPMRCYRLGGGRG